MVEDGAKVLEFPKPKAVPQVEVPRPAPKPEPKEHYRIGYISETGMTTLTLMADSGWSSTLSMNKPACEQLIKMIRATYEDEDDTPNPDPDGGLPLPEEVEDKKAA